MPRGRGRPRLYDGKVLWKQFEPARWQNQGQLEAGLTLYTATLYHVSQGKRTSIS